MTAPSTLLDIRNKVRRITARPSSAQITDNQIDEYINTYYIYDLPEHLHLQNLRYNYQFTTQSNQQVYDFPKEFYLTNMPPVYIAGYQSYMTQSRENFFRINPNLMMMQNSVTQGNGTAGPYTFTLTQTPITRGFKPNPPGAYTGAINDIQPRYINFNVIITAQGAANLVTGVSPSYTLVDDGMGNLVSTEDPYPDPSLPLFPQNYTVCGSINYQTGNVTVTKFVTLSGGALIAAGIPSGNPINAQYIPYVASRPQSVVFYQDQFLLYPIPDQAYTVSFEAFKYPTAFMSSPADPTTQNPQLKEWWQLLAFGASDKIFCDNGDIENLQKFRPLLDEQMRLVQRRTIVQQTSERTASIYTEQSQFPQYPFGNLFSGF